MSSTLNQACDREALAGDASEMLSSASKTVTGEKFGKTSPAAPDDRRRPVGARQSAASGTKLVAERAGYRHLEPVTLSDHAHCRLHAHLAN
jgi:hypothetical protein